MLKIFKNPILYAVLISLGAAPLEAASRFDWGPYSLRLAEDMTEQAAISAIGYQPNKVERKTCGADTSGGEWECRILTFGNNRSSLTVFERRSDELWVVNSWMVDP
jgi:hypothetical protein